MGRDWKGVCPFCTDLGVWDGPLAQDASAGGETLRFLII